MRKVIPIQVKKECCRLRAEGKSYREIYRDYYTTAVDNPAEFDSFRRLLHRWMAISFPDETTLQCGTYDGFTAHDATVQVSRTGEIVQAWIKQRASDINPDVFIEAIRGNVEPFVYTPRQCAIADRMLEIPLFDMHWGVAFMDYYEPVLNELLDLITSKSWDKIVIPFGQDFFHNDSIVDGKTTKGTPIEKVDMIRAVKEGQTFIYALIDTALQCANKVEVLYSAGNHDRSTAWMFMQVLLERYGEAVVDDSLEYRKVVTYGKNSIMLTHGDSKQATAKNLAHIFPISFANEFANADVREVHAGHLHHEAEADIFGVMVRRLSSGGKIDEWTNRQDFVGSHRRFMVFEWDRVKLKSIHYI
jgi:UDP-2,3-diacylglucosamine pyrophosphatase LpxH